MMAESGILMMVRGRKHTAVILRPQDGNSAALSPRLPAIEGAFH